jgi:hypothetical protein
MFLDLKRKLKLNQTHLLEMNLSGAFKNQDPTRARNEVLNMSSTWVQATPPEPTRRYWIYSIPGLSFYQDPSNMYGNKPKIEPATIMNSVLKGIYLDPSIYHF